MKVLFVKVLLRMARTECKKGRKSHAYESAQHCDHSAQYTCRERRCAAQSNELRKPVTNSRVCVHRLVLQKYLCYDEKHTCDVYKNRTNDRSRTECLVRPKVPLGLHDFKPKHKKNDSPLVSQNNHHFSSISFVKLFQFSS